jgi:hypothetical protein
MQGRRLTTEPNDRRWVALGAIAVGILVVATGVWVLNWGAQAPPAAVANTVASPTAGRLARLNETATATATATAAPTSTRTPIPLPTYTTTPSPDVALPTPVGVTDGTIPITILHSNDTWGYTLPCG